MDRYPEKRDLFSGVLSVPGGRYIVEDNRRKFVAGWADFSQEERSEQETVSL